MNEQLSGFTNNAFTDATFDDRADRGRRQQSAGCTFRMTPHHAFSIGGTATTRRSEHGQFLVTLIWSCKTKHHFEDDDSSFGHDFRQDAFGTINLRAAWRSPKGRWKLTGYVENLRDEDCIIDAGKVGGSFGIPTVTAGDTRRFGRQTSLRW